MTPLVNHGLWYPRTQSRCDARLHLVAHALVYRHDVADHMGVTDALLTAITGIQSLRWLRTRKTHRRPSSRRP
jgi:hypothetical protein